MTVIRLPVYCYFEYNIHFYTLYACKIYLDFIYEIIIVECSPHCSGYFDIPTGY